MSIKEIGFIRVDNLIANESDQNLDKRKSRPSKSEAKQLRENYANTSDKPVLTMTTKSSTKVQMIGFSIPKEELLLALNSHSDNSNKGIHLAFGLSENNQEPKLDGTTILIYGIDKNDAIIEDKVAGKPTIFDYCHPCDNASTVEISLPSTIE